MSDELRSLMTTQTEARLMCAAINNYWAKRGISANAGIFAIRNETSGKAISYAIRSAITANGTPARAMWTEAAL